MQPTLYMMFGYPGAGKTTAAEVIHKLTGAAHLSSDKLRLEMFPQPTFSQAEHDQLYKQLDKKTEELLRSGKSVVYDANLNRYKHRQDKYDICQIVGAKPVLIWVQTPREIAKNRAMHDSRQHLWPANETASQLFERIAGLIEVPQEGETYINIDGTKLNPTYVQNRLAASDQL